MHVVQLLEELGGPLVEQGHHIGADLRKAAKEDPDAPDDEQVDSDRLQHVWPLANSGTSVNMLHDLSVHRSRKCISQDCYLHLDRYHLACLEPPFVDLRAFDLQVLR